MTAVIDTHQAAGQFFDVGRVRTFRLDQGEGEPVVLMHGVPASCFLYRKVVPALAAHGLRAIAFDLPGLGLADRPVDFDYSWSGLGRFATAAMKALELERFHLVVHDIGGPVGFEVAAALPERIASLTILNTLIEVEKFRKPWTMRPFEKPGLNRVWLSSMKTQPMFRQLMAWQGVKDMSKVTKEELNAYVDLLFGDDNGRGFLRIMGSFETSPEKTERYRAVVTSDQYPKQVIWGEHDTALPLEKYGRIAERLTGTMAKRLPGKHFLQEDQYEAIAEAIARFVGVDVG